MRCRAIQGFTLMEMVVTLTVLALMAAVAAPYLSTGVQAFNETASAVHTLSNIRTAGERLTREIREIRRDAAGNYDIAMPLSPTGLAFTKSDGETVVIDVAGSVLRLAYGSVPGSPTLVDAVSGFTLSYWQSDGTSPATGSGNVAYIDFELVVSRNGNSYPQRSRVALRNQP